MFDVPTASPGTHQNQFRRTTRMMFQLSSIQRLKNFRSKFEPLPHPSIGANLEYFEKLLAFFLIAFHLIRQRVFISTLAETNTQRTPTRTHPEPTQKTLKSMRTLFATNQAHQDVC